LLFELSFSWQDDATRPVNLGKTMFLASACLKSMVER